VLNNTGESISIAVQARGNYGDADQNTAPTTGIRLPQSNAGGFGTSTNTGLTLTGTTGALVKKTGTASLSTTDLTGDVNTNGSPASTVVAIQGTPVSNAAPNTGDILRYNMFGDAKYDLVNSTLRFITVFADLTTNPVTIGHGDSPVTLGTSGAVASTATEPPGRSFTSAASASLNVVAGVRQGWGANITLNEIMTDGTTYRFRQRLKMNNSSSVRYWLGVSQGNTADFTGSAALATDTPNRVYAPFSVPGWNGLGNSSSLWHKQRRANCGEYRRVDTSASKMFEIAWVAGTRFRFHIDGSLVATITTNLPSSSTRFGTFWCCDSLNSATAVGLRSTPHISH
jgi:hypothetical protein